MQFLQTITTGIDEDFKNFAPLKWLASTANVKPSMIVLPLILFILITSLVFPSFGSKLITIFTIIYPSYMAFEAVHEKNHQKCKKWMAFWLIFCFFLAFDGLIKTILFFLPAYYAFKFLFFLWLFYPRTDGVMVLHQKIFKPYVSKIKEEAKKMVQQIKTS